MKISNFVDDNFSRPQNKNKQACIKSMEAKLKVIVKWLKDSGLKGNKSKKKKNYHKDTPQVEILISSIKVKSKDHMNVLGVIFDSKLT